MGCGCGGAQNGVSAQQRREERAARRLARQNLVSDTSNPQYRHTGVPAPEVKVRGRQTT